MPAPDPTAEWWTTSDVAAHCGVTVGTISSYRGRGQMPPPDQTVGRTHLWRPSAIVEWHASRRKAHRVGGSRYRVRAGRRETAFTKDHGTNWDDPATGLDRRFETVPAAGWVSEMLEVPLGELVLARHFTFWASGRPQQMSVSCLPWALVEGTPIADPANEPWTGGTVAQMASIGVAVTDVEEQPSARSATQGERDVLGLEDDEPVLVIARRFLAGDRPVEAAEIVIPPARARLLYRSPV